MTNPTRENLHATHLVILTLVVSVVDVGAPKNGARTAGMDGEYFPLPQWCNRADDLVVGAVGCRWVVLRGGFY